VQEKVRQGINWTGASSAARNEVLFLSHMAAAHSSAMQLLDREGEARLLTERTRRTAFLTNAREALGAQTLPATHPHPIHRLVPKQSRPIPVSQLD
jgi:hypothetical protein